MAVYFFRHLNAIFICRFYIGLTHDLDWLADAQPGFGATGGDLALETAKFWESRPTFDEDREMWEINGKKFANYFLNKMSDDFFFSFCCSRCHATG